MEITEIKQVYPEFKFFKDIFTRIKLSESITFSKGEDSNSIKLVFSKDNPFYILTGKLEGNTEFLKWVNLGKEATLSLQDINSIAKCLKKNALSIELNDEVFKFKFNDKEGVYTEVDSLQKDTFNFETPFKTIEYNEYKLKSEIFKDDLIRLYRRNNVIEPIKSEGSELLLEVPRTSLLSFQPKSEEVLVRFTKNSEKDRKYVEIETTYENLTLTQLFATI